MANNFHYKWNLKDALFTKDKGKVFSCFACGGGSTMGYKLAGYDVLGCNEIDPKMMDVYRKNHNPKYAFLEPIQAFKEREDLPEELFNLDILDGSPPCSSFSISGNREKDWGKEKKFREGQAEQVLDTLFFDFIDLAKRLQPKVVVAENVKGLLLGEAKRYVRKIYQEFDMAGYYVQHWLLDASKMGVPQRRERVFFIALRKDLALPFMNQVDLFTDAPKLKLEFRLPKILFGEIKDEQGRMISVNMQKIWEKRKFGDSDLGDAYFRDFQKVKFFSQNYIYAHKVSKTVTSHEDSLVLYDSPRFTSRDEVCKIGTFPLDYDFGKNKPHYIVGMSVPPLMVAQISKQIYEQWLSKINVYA
jgi:DNA (cytosine-5)-methyltransferase 1